MISDRGAAQAGPIRAGEVQARSRFDLVAAMRPHQWIKNAVVFAAPLFALRTDLGTFVSAGVAFGIFCAASSGVYLLNDVRDLEADRRHPLKWRRAIASGRVPVSVALAMAGLLLSSSVILAFVDRAQLGVVVVGYLAVQAAYNTVLKHEPIVDIMCIAAGFVLRALGGAAATQVPASTWFLLSLGFLAFYLGIEKRKAELQLHDGATIGSRAVLRFYSAAWLGRMESVVTASALMSYSLWVIARTRTPWMLLTVPFVAYTLFRYQFLAEKGHGEAPDRALIRSPHIVIAVVLWALTALVILYLQAKGVPAFMPEDLSTSS